MRRNTPTGVGTTRARWTSATFREKHPHGRGDDSCFRRRRMMILETPPRAWGRPQPWRFEALGRGNTPTGVGTTRSIPRWRPAPVKHPHGRGDDRCDWSRAIRPAETPPRAWGRLGYTNPDTAILRNTPTGVGTTLALRPVNGKQRKHPHGRGDDKDEQRAHRSSLETPPRAWGRRRYNPIRNSASRNTPTGVGTTAGLYKPRLRREKHPHGRGDDKPASSPLAPRLETPPRAWGRPRYRHLSHTGERNTPTGVGTTKPLHPFRRIRRKHPHGRGDDIYELELENKRLETPPRAWGRHQHIVKELT